MKKMLMGILLVLISTDAAWAFRDDQSGRCVLQPEIYRDYKKLVDKSDGVTMREAELIAQKELLNRKTKNYFLNIHEEPVLDGHDWIVKLWPYADGPSAGNKLKICVDKNIGNIDCYEEIEEALPPPKVIRF